MKNWKKYEPIFDFDEVNEKIREHSAWKGHFNFAYDLIRFMKPSVFVELGSHYGGSFFSFCQGAKDDGLSTKCYAIDMWKGDSHTGSYGDHVFSLVESIATQYYSDHAKLVRSTFDEAAPHFEDESIDLLHIDGLHTYEAVRNDYETWLPKLAPNGIVLFHDISVQINDFGVYRLWDELKAQLPSFEFHHSFGLGVLFPKGVGEKFIDILARKELMGELYDKKIHLKGQKLHYFEIDEDLYLYYHPSKQEEKKSFFEIKIDTLDHHYPLNITTNLAFNLLDDIPIGKTYRSIIVPTYMTTLTRTEIFQWIEKLLPLVRETLLIAIEEKDDDLIGIPDFKDYDITYFQLEDQRHLFKIYKGIESWIPQLYPLTDEVQSLSILYVMPHRNLTGGMKMLYSQAKFLQQRGHKIKILKHHKHEKLPDWVVDFIPDEEITVPEGTRPIDAIISSGCDIIFSGWYQQIKELENDEIPVIYWEQGHEWLYGDIMQDRNSETWIRQNQLTNYQGNVYLASDSKYVRDVIRTRFHRDSHLLPCFIDNSSWYPLKQPLQNEIPTILLVGNPSLKFKGFDKALATLERAWSEGVRFQVDWICQHQPLISKVYPFQIKLHVNLPQADLPDVYRHADVLLTCSWYEGHPMPPLEAMASGVAVISTNSGGINQFGVNGENVMIAYSNSVQELTQHLKKVLHDHDLRNTLIKNGLETAKKMSEKNICLLLEHLLVSAVKDDKQKKLGVHYQKKEEIIIGQEEEDARPKIVQHNKILIVICVNNEGVYKQCERHIKMIAVPKGFELDILVIRDAKGMCEAYNRAQRHSDAKYKVYIHQDTFLIHLNMFQEMIELFQKNEKLGMIGVVGTQDLPENGVWWEGENKVGHVIEHRMTHFAQWNNWSEAPNKYDAAYIPVQAIDGLFMATQYDLPWKEDLFLGFHFYDISHTQEFINAGYEVGVPSRERCWCIHYGVGINTFNWENWDKNRQIFVNEYLGNRDLQNEKFTPSIKEEAVYLLRRIEHDIQKEKSVNQIKSYLKDQLLTKDQFFDIINEFIIDKVAARLMIEQLSLNENKICFITCVTNERQYEEALLYIDQLALPENFEIEKIAIRDAKSMAEGYNRAMKQSDAKYKVYLHQDVFIINPNFIFDFLKPFNQEPLIGILGVVGAKKLPENGIWWEANELFGSVFDRHTGKMALHHHLKVDSSFEIVEALDGLILITQYDIPWREDLFDWFHFYDISQCMEFMRHGYLVAIPRQSTPFVIHDYGVKNWQERYDDYRKRFLAEYVRDFHLKDNNQ